MKIIEDERILGKYPNTKFVEIEPILVEIEILKNVNERRVRHLELTTEIIEKTIDFFKIYFLSILQHNRKKYGNKLNPILKQIFGDQYNRSMNLISLFDHITPSKIEKIYQQAFNKDIAKETIEFYDDRKNDGVAYERCHLRNIPLFPNNYPNLNKIFGYYRYIRSGKNVDDIPHMELRKMIGVVFDYMNAQNIKDLIENPTRVQYGDNSFKFHNQAGATTQKLRIKFGKSIMSITNKDQKCKAMLNLLLNDRNYNSNFCYNATYLLDKLMTNNIMKRKHAHIIVYGVIYYCMKKHLRNIPVITTFANDNHITPESVSKMVNTIEEMAVTLQKKS